MGGARAYFLTGAGLQPIACQGIGSPQSRRFAVTEDQQPEQPQPKLEWVKPVFQKLDVGAAEGRDGTGSDAQQALS